MGVLHQAVVLHGPQAVVAQLVGEDRLLDDLGEQLLLTRGGRSRQLRLDQQREPHLAGASASASSAYAPRYAGGSMRASSTMTVRVNARSVRSSASAGGGSGSPSRTVMSRRRTTP